MLKTQCRLLPGPTMSYGNNNFIKVNEGAGSWNLRGSRYDRVSQCSSVETCAGILADVVVLAWMIGM